MRKSKKLISLILIFSFFVLIGIRYIYINNKYPKAIDEAYNIGESVNYRGLEIKAEEIRFIGDEEIRNMNLQENEFFENDKRKAICVTISFKNTSSESKYIESDFFEVSTIDWHNGLNYEIFYNINKDGATPSLRLEPNEEVTLEFPYEMFDFQFNRNEWGEVEKLQFNLVLDIYPVKKYIIIQA